MLVGSLVANEPTIRVKVISDFSNQKAMFDCLMVSGLFLHLMGARIMRWIFGLLVFQLVLLSHSAVGAELPVKTAALCLAEVMSVEEHDQTAYDGGSGVKAKLKFIKSSGPAQDQIDIGKAYGGLGPNGLPDPPPLASLAKALAKGVKIWLAFSADKEVIAWWPEDAANVKELETAIRNDRFQRKEGTRR